MHKDLPILKVENLSVGYTGHCLFKNLNLSLIPGQLVCLMGPNGIGKTSLIKTLAGILSPLSGSSSVQIKKNSSEKIAIVINESASPGDLTVQEMVFLGRYPYLNWFLRKGERDFKIVEEAMHFTGVNQFAKKRVSTLSDGQMQLVMISRAIAQETPIMLLDEPTAHLDLNNRVEIMNLLRRLCRERGKAILIATHELDLALQTADHIWLADRNQFIHADIPENLVLNDVIDQIFQFKGFTLKTGRVDQHPEKSRFFNLNGSGYALLWTKNALERSGYGIQNSAIDTIEIIESDSFISWKTDGLIFNKISDLLMHLENNNGHA